MTDRSRILFPVLLAVVCGACASDRDDVVRHEPPVGSVPNDQMRAVLRAHEELDPIPLTLLSVDEARQQPTLADAVTRVLEARGQDASPQPVGSEQSLSIPGPGGQHEIPLTVLTPGGDGPFPVLVYFHGGGWVVGTPADDERSARALVNAAVCTVVMPAYRQAPEHRFPAAHDDAIAAYQWVLGNAARVRGDPSRVAVGGEGAGGNLAAATALRARDEGLPPPVHQLLVYPVTNHAFGSSSYVQYVDARPLDAVTMRWFFGHYLRDDEDGEDPRVSPLRATDAQLAGSPGATILTAEIDPLRDDGRDYARRLREAGVDVAYRNFPGVTHGFFGAAPVVDDATEAVELAAQRLRSAFAR